VSRVDVVAAVVLAAGTLAVSPGVAAAQCPEANPSYMDACGPTFAVPTWTDSGGWTDPSQYSTIRLADFNGDGRDELMARNGQGLEIWWFDTSVGQWRPQVDANGFPQALTDFRSPRPGETLATDWTKPQYYSTIQAADIDGQPGEEILARFSDGMRVYRYSPPAGGSSIDGGSWSLIGQGGPFSDAGGYGGDPSLYSTIRAARFRGGEPPMLFARAHPQTGRMTLAVYTWNQNGTWTPVPEPGQYGGVIDGFSDSSCGLPSCYLTIQAANVFPNDPDSAGSTNAVMGHNATGLAGYDLDSSFAGWNIPDSSTDLPYGPFSDVANSPDCPFTASSPDCLGSSPSYYETQSGANVDGQPGDELFARAIDGLRVKHWVPPYWPPNGQCCFKDSSFEPYATLTDLAGSGLVEVTAPGLWGSIRTGDINADGRDEVLALDGKALQAWSYDPGSDSWSRLQPSTAPALTDDWLTKPEYYATIRVGDVDGDGRDDVIARGQYGMRTWFYDRRGSGGWERYLPEGYPDFPGTATPPAQNTGQAAAYDKLNDLAKGDSHTPTLREVWAGEPTPDTTLLQKLQQDLPGPLLGNCSNQTVLEPPTYASCTPPPPPAGGSNRFTADDWKAVVNEMLAESQAAIEVANFYTGPTNSLTSMRQSLFIAEGAELPAMGDKLRLQAAANTPVTYDFQSLFAGGLGIAASIAGVAEPEFSAALWVASELASTIPAPSATANSSFHTTYADLEDQFAAMVTEIDKSIAEQSQQVRQDKGLMELVGELRRRGTWNMDTIGVGSAANQGFAAWVYSTLMPTIYERYSITNCRDQFAGDGTDCIAPTGLGVVGDNQNFAVIGQRHQLDVFRNEQVPCLTQINNTGDGPDKFITCTWTKPPDDLLNRIWAPVDPSCSYVPGQSSTVWTFSCSAGVDPAKSIGDNSWGFPSYAGNPDPYNAPGGFSASASAAQADPPCAAARRCAPTPSSRGGCGWRARPSSWTGCCSTGAAAASSRDRTAVGHRGR
jgi:FG-GAP-like repeat